MDLYNLVVSAKLSKGGGGDEPVLSDKTISANGTYNASSDNADGYKKVVANVPSVTPTGNINITSTAQTDVSAYATAQVVDADLVASNIKKDVDILGVVGTYEGGGGGGALSIGEATMRIEDTSAQESITFTNLLGTPKMAYVFKTEYRSRTSSSSVKGIINLFWDGQAIRGANYMTLAGSTYESENLNQIEAITTANSITFTSLSEVTADPGWFIPSSKTPSSTSYKLIYFY